MEHVIADGAWLCARLESTGTQRGDLFGWLATSEKAPWKEVRYRRIGNDKTVEHPASIDTAGMPQQLGHIAPPERSRW